ncbi:DNA repair protein RadC [Zavarzinia compransoris]|uniref:RadC family protein n=1 Tax=Zavarzinia marina TaxID=2911065 RepID=UPI001F1F0274|nr:DNA repair protein RadC [Zavarzinia marina]MCF4164357.1 DNA repair protein RadC [Zavarzinia marina]
MAPETTPAPDDRKPGDESPEAAPHYHGHRGRLRARFRETGGQGMPDYEILELLLALAIPRRDVKPLAKDLIARFGSLADLLAAPLDQIERQDGMGEIAAIAVKTVREAALRLLAADVVKKPVISSWAALLDYCRARLARESREETRVLFLDRKNVLIADEGHGKGTVDQSPLYIREVVKRALDLSASALILVHNHPSGDPTPSRADIDMTRDLAKALKGVGIALHDHLVIGRHGHASFKSLGLL